MIDEINLCDFHRRMALSARSSAGFSVARASRLGYGGAGMFVGSLGKVASLVFLYIPTVCI